MASRTQRFAAVAVVLAATLARAQSTAPVTPDASADAAALAGIAARYAALAGSRDNAVTLATALHDARPATLAYVTASSRNGTAVSTITFAPPTAAMAWRDAWHALAFAQQALAAAGIARPTGDELHAALLGGTVASGDGRATPLAGVLQQRAAGMTWPQMAQSYGTTMRADGVGVDDRTAPDADNAASGPLDVATGIRGTFMPVTVSRAGASGRAAQ